MKSMRVCGITAKEEKPGLLTLLVEDCLKNPYVWLFAISYFFVYVVRQGVTSWFIFYLKVWALQLAVILEQCHSVFMIVAGVVFGCCAVSDGKALLVLCRTRGCRTRQCKCLGLSWVACWAVCPPAPSLTTSSATMMAPRGMSVCVSRSSSSCSGERSSSENCEVVARR